MKILSTELKFVSFDQQFSLVLTDAFITLSLLLTDYKHILVVHILNSFLNNNKQEYRSLGVRNGTKTSIRRGRLMLRLGVFTERALDRDESRIWVKALEKIYQILIDKS